MTQPYVLAQGFGHSFFGVAVAAIPLLTILMSIPMLGLWPTGRQLVGVFGGLVCLWFVVEDGFHRGMSLGLLALAAVVPITAAFNNTFVKLKLTGAQALPVTAVMLGSAGLMLLPLEFCRPAIDGPRPRRPGPSGVHADDVGLSLSCWAWWRRAFRPWRFSTWCSNAARCLPA